jgi:hypothetical protein
MKITNECELKNMNCFYFIDKINDIIIISYSKDNK